MDVRKTAIYFSILLLISSCGGKQSQNHNADQSHPSESRITPIANDRNDIAKLPDGTEIIINTSPFLNRYTLQGNADPALQEAVRGLFEQFKDAVMHYDGQTSVSLLSSASLNYYANVLSAARLLLHDGRNYQNFEPKLPPTVKTTARLAVSRLSADYIDHATPEQLYETAFKQGWIGYKTLSSARIEQIDLYTKGDDKYLLANFLYEGTPHDKLINKIGFQYEGGSWKIDLVPLYVAIDLAIDDMVKREHLDEKDVFEATIDDTNKKFLSDNWPVYNNQKDMFSVRFPKTPTEDAKENIHIYTAVHHLYGQFGVIITDTVFPKDDPIAAKTFQDAALKSFLVPLGADKPVCTAGKLETHDETVIKCDFRIPDKQSQGKGVWIFGASRQYQLFNIARTDQYNDEVVVRFIESFKFLEEKSEQVPANAPQ